jgi:hypothetical protein
LVAIDGGGAVTSEAKADGDSSSSGIGGDHTVNLAGGIMLESESVLRTADWKTGSRGSKQLSRMAYA